MLKREEGLVARHTDEQRNGWSPADVASESSLKTGQVEPREAKKNARYSLLPPK